MTLAASEPYRFEGSKLAASLIAEGRMLSVEEQSTVIICQVN